MEDLTFLGKGAKFPFQVNPATGRVVVSDKYDNIRESIYVILMTARSERPMRPDFGSDLMSYTFMDVSQTRITLMKQSIVSDILENEPRVTDVEVDISNDTDRGCLMIDISYVVADDNTPGSLVFPFYLNSYEEENTDYDGTAGDVQA